MNEVKKNNVITDKSFNFSTRIVKFYQYLKKEKQEFIICKQLLRSGTSIGANVREAINAQSKKDFISKLAISQKECDETIYWLELLYATEIINEKEFNSIKNDADELLKIIRSIILTSKLHS